MPFFVFLRFLFTLNLNNLPPSADFTQIAVVAPGLYKAHHLLCGIRLYDATCVEQQLIKL